MKKPVIKPKGKESCKILDDHIVQLTKELRKVAKGFSNASLAFKIEYTSNKNITYEDKL